jgi:hypothetical protein
MMEEALGSMRLRKKDRGGEARENSKGEELRKGPSLVSPFPSIGTLMSDEIHIDLEPSEFRS